MSPCVPEMACPASSTLPGSPLSSKESPRVSSLQAANASTLHMAMVLVFIVLPRYAPHATSVPCSSHDVAPRACRGPGKHTAIRQLVAADRARLAATRPARTCASRASALVTWTPPVGLDVFDARGPALTMNIAAQLE